MRRKIYRLGLIMTIALVALTGCNDKKEVDYDVSTEGEVTTEAVEEIETEVSYELAGDNYNIKVDATIELPEDYTNCSVVSISEDYFTDEDIEDMADKIFDEGSYFLYMPYTQEQIDFLREKLNDILSNTSDEELAFVLNDKLIMLNVFEGYNIQENEDLVIDGYKFYTVDDGVYEYEGQIICDIMGTIDGEWYMLKFNNTNGGSVMLLQNMVDSLLLDNVDITINSYEMGIEGNTCSYTEEEAIKLATDYIADLGYTDYAVNNVNNVLQRKYNYETYEYKEKVSGYRVCFGRTYENYTVAYSDWNTRSNGQADSEMNEAIVVYVTDEGVISLVVCNPHKFESVLAENTSMLSFEKIETIVNERFTEAATENSLNFTVTGIKLGYGMEKGSDGQKALVPVWYYYNDNTTGSQFYINDIIRVNAIDGNVLYNTFY